VKETISRTPELIQSLFISPSCSIHQTIACIDKGGLGIALLVNDELRILANITDGDVRRAMLAGIDLETPVSALLASKAGMQYLLTHQWDKVNNKWKLRYQVSMCKDKGSVSGNEECSNA
jgi:hypothetical protein